MSPVVREETDFGDGEYTISDPRVPGVPAFSTSATGSITITWASNGNDPVVTYALRVKEDPELDGSYTVKGYVQTDGTVDAAEAFQTLAAWGATVAVSGLTEYYAYTFAAKARNQADTDSAYSAESEIMATLPLVDGGLASTPLAREVTGGNVKLDETTGIVLSGNTATEIDGTAYYGNITLTALYLSYESDAATVEAQYSEDSGGTWAGATLVGTTTGLTTSPTGVSHAVAWNSYTDAGTSEYQTDVRVRMRAQDAEGDWGPWLESADFIIYNRPAKPVVVNADSRAWDEDTTPVFMAVIPHFRGDTGSKGFPEIAIYETTTGTPLVAGYPRRSYETPLGWEYESAPSTWVTLTVAGIPYTAADGVNRMRYTVQTALATGDYTVTMTMYENRDRG